MILAVEIVASSCAHQNAFFGKGGGGEGGGGDGGGGVFKFLRLQKTHGCSKSEGAWDLVFVRCMPPLRVGGGFGGAADKRAGKAPAAAQPAKRGRGGGGRGGGRKPTGVNTPGVDSVGAPKRKQTNLGELLGERIVKKHKSGAEGFFAHVGREREGLRPTVTPRFVPPAAHGGAAAPAEGPAEDSDSE